MSTNPKNMTENTLTQEIKELYQDGMQHFVHFKKNKTQVENERLVCLLPPSQLVSFPSLPFDAQHLTTALHYIKFNQMFPFSHLHHTHISLC